MGRPPARAVLWHDNLWAKFLQGLDGWGDDRLKDTASEMKASDNRVNFVDTCDVFCVELV